MDEYLTLWWAGELVLHYQPFGLEMHQFNKILKIGLYFFGLLGLFELIHFSVVMRQFKFITITYATFNKLPWNILSSLLTLAPKLITGLILLIKRKITAKLLFMSIISPHIKDVVKSTKDEANISFISHCFQWLSDHPLNETIRRVVIFSAFSLLSLVDIFTS
jgi:hypothetical protein